MISNIMILKLLVCFFHTKLVIGDMGKIVGGRVAEAKEFPWAVSLQYYREHYCGGSVFTERHVLTACHCTARSAYPHDEPDYFTVSDRQAIAGSIYNFREHPKFQGQIRQLLKHFAHPNCTSRATRGGWDSDYALILLVKPYALNDYLQPLKPPKDVETKGWDRLQDMIDEGAICTAVGWGFTKIILPGEYDMLSMELMALDLKLMSYRECSNRVCDLNEEYCQFDMKKRFQVCARTPDNKEKDVCNGDSGGPLSCGEEVHGVVGWGPSCGEDPVPSMFGSIAVAWNWMESIKSTQYNGKDGNSEGNDDKGHGNSSNVIAKNSISGFFPSIFCLMVSLSLLY